MAKKPSNNFEEGASSNKNMRPTQAGKEFRDFEYSIYEHTSFETHRSEYCNLCQKIRTQRLMEHLGRYKSREQKISQLKIFKDNFLRLKELLFLMTKEADKYKSIVSTGASSKDVKSTNVSLDYEISFRKKIRKDLKDIQTWWIQLFVEGSLKRLIPALNLLRIPDDQIDFGLDITQWHIETQFKFSTYHQNKSCCCG